MFKAIQAMLLALLFLSCDEDQRYLFNTFESPDKKFHLKVFYNDPPIFGPHRVCFKILNKQNAQEVEKDCRTLNNDGANLTDANIQIQWLGHQVAQVILRGQQQQPDTLILKME